MDKEINNPIENLKAKEYLYRFWQTRSKIAKEIFQSFLKKNNSPAHTDKYKDMSLPDIGSIDIIKDEIDNREIEITKTLFGETSEYFSEKFGSYIIQKEGIQVINKIIYDTISLLDVTNQKYFLYLLDDLWLDKENCVSNSSSYRWFVNTLLNISANSPKYRTCISIFFLKYISNILMQNYSIFKNKDNLLLETKNHLSKTLFDKEIIYENNDLSDIIKNGWSGSFRVSTRDIQTHLTNKNFKLPLTGFDSEFLQFEANTKGINSAVDKMIADKKYDLPMLFKDILRSTIIAKNSNDVIKMMYIILANKDLINHSSGYVDMIDIEIEDKNMLYSSFWTNDVRKITKQFYKIIPQDDFGKQILDSILSSKKARHSSSTGYQDAKFRISYKLRDQNVWFGSEIIFFDAKSRKIREEDCAHWKKNFVRWFDTMSRSEKLMPTGSITKLVEEKKTYISQNVDIWNKNQVLDQAIFEAQEEIKEEIRSKYIKIIYRPTINHKEERFYIHPKVLYDDICHGYFPSIVWPFYIADHNWDIINNKEKLKYYLNMIYKKNISKTFIAKAFDDKNILK